MDKKLGLKNGNSDENSYKLGQTQTTSDENQDENLGETWGKTQNRTKLERNWDVLPFFCSDSTYYT